jgi:DNA phosphorothioation-dependent restriction protein DptG
MTNDHSQPYFFVLEEQTAKREKSQITNSQTNFRETVSSLLFLVSISLLSLFTNDQ